MNFESRTIVVATPDELCALIRSAVRAEISFAKPVSATKEVLDEKQAASYIGQKPGTLRQWRSSSKGPAYHKKGRRVFYKKIDLDRFLEMDRVEQIQQPVYE